MPPSSLKVGKSANDALALTNCVVVNKNEFANTPSRYIIINNQFVFTIMQVDPADIDAFKLVC
jgi:hypothetical protein